MEDEAVFDAQVSWDSDDQVCIMNACVLRFTPRLVTNYAITMPASRGRAVSVAVDQRRSVSSWHRELLVGRGYAMPVAQETCRRGTESRHCRAGQRACRLSMWSVTLPACDLGHTRSCSKNILAECMRGCLSTSNCRVGGDSLTTCLIDRSET